MARPAKDRTGITERWRMTTVRVPRWLADQVRDQAVAEGYAEVWEVLLRGPSLRIPTPVPARYRHLGPAIGTGALLLMSADVDAVVIELQAMGVAVERVGEQGLRPAEAAGWRFRRPEDVDKALEANMAFAAKVREAVGRVRERDPTPNDAPSS